MKTKNQWIEGIALFADKKYLTLQISVRYGTDTNEVTEHAIRFINRKKYDAKKTAAYLRCLAGMVEENIKNIDRYNAK